ncbi:unnamed protein product [Litomosoides sigmodontis]|uniref:Uncharacterized protein n=1 Tax=Litomosoides sigmodontis TaxID=42156 RepID=A0A3P6VAY5_LITSI|nr:unnamed protein product [Litomosoides sigmodontis]
MIVAVLRKLYNGHIYSCEIMELEISRKLVSVDTFRAIEVACHCGGAYQVAAVTSNVVGKGEAEGVMVRMRGVVFRDISSLILPLMMFWLWLRFLRSRRNRQLNFV